MQEIWHGLTRLMCMGLPVLSTLYTSRWVTKIQPSHCARAGLTNVIHLLMQCQHLTLVFIVKWDEIAARHK
eukprot:1400250-Karenia_brevis.AAC.1